MSANLKLAPPAPTNAYQRISRNVGYGGASVELPTLAGARQLGRMAIDDELAMAELLSTVRRAPRSKTEHDVEVMSVLQQAAKTCIRIWEKRAP